MRSLPFFCCLLPLWGSWCFAVEPPTLVQKVLGRASAPEHTRLSSGSAFSTGPRSKSELALPSGVARVGAESVVETSPRGLVLQRGMTLVASEPGRLRKSIEVKAPGYRLQVKGTVQVAFEPGRSLKLVVLEGTATVALDSLMGEFESLSPGQMLVINPSDRRLPDPVEVDVQRLAATSGLVGGGFGPLATAGNIKNATTAQAQGYARGDAQATPLLLRGLDNNLEIENRRLATAGATVPRQARPVDTEIAIFNLHDDLADPRAVTQKQTFQYDDGNNFASTVEGTTFRRNTRNPSRTHVLEAQLRPELSDDEDSLPIAKPEIKGDVTIDPLFFGSDSKKLLFSVSGNNPENATLLVAPGTRVFTPRGVHLGFDAKFGLEVDLATLTAGAARNEVLEIAARDGLKITGSVLKGGIVNLHGGDSSANITIDQSAVTPEHPDVKTSKITAAGRLAIGQSSSPTKITISNSSELRSLAEHIVLRSNRADIQVTSNALLKAPKGYLIIDAAGPDAMDTTPGTITVSDAQLGARSIRLHGYSPSGDALIIDKSTLTAGKYIELFADGASTLRFRGDVKLQAPLAVLAGQRVEVENGAVKITGKGRVYTGDPQYNIPGKGSINDKYGPVVSKPYGDFKH